MTTDKQADLAGPGISTYEKVEKILPTDYESLLTPRETMEALFEVKRYIEDNLCKELNLMMVQVPLIVDEASGSTIISTAMARAPRCSSPAGWVSTSLSRHRLFRQPRSGSGWRSRPSIARQDRVSAPT